jgi:hypothetical protein
MPTVARPQHKEQKILLSFVPLLRRLFPPTLAPLTTYCIRTSPNPPMPSSPTPPSSPVPVVVGIGPEVARCRWRSRRRFVVFFSHGELGLFEYDAPGRWRCRRYIAAEIGITGTEPSSFWCVSRMFECLHMGVQPASLMIMSSSERMPFWSPWEGSQKSVIDVFGPEYSREPNWFDLNA